MQYIFNFAATKFIYMTSVQQAKELEKILNEDRKTAIISHFNPDGDAVGASVGMRSFLLSAGKDADIVIPSRQPEFLDFLDPEAAVFCLTNEKTSGRAKKKKRLQTVCPKIKFRPPF